MSAQDIQFKQNALRGRYLTNAQVDKCTRIQNRTAGRKVKRLDEISIEQGYVTREQLEDLYAGKPMERPVRTIGGYEIVSVLGEGGLGTVYLARQKSMKREVALKVLHAQWLDDEEFRKRFLLEARLVGKMSHQNLIQVFDVGMDGNELYFSMEYVPGINVQQMIDAGQPIELGQSIEIVTQVSRAINYYKEYNVVHRDIKPSNIFVTPQGIAKLGDFGFIKTQIDKELSREGYILGTPDYISPEQARWLDDVDYRSDVYSLGATLYHMLTATTPFIGSESAVIRQHMKLDFPSPLNYRPDLPDDMVIILERMMAKKPEDRYDDLGQLCDELNMVKLGQHPVSARRLDPGKSAILRDLDITEKRIMKLDSDRRTLRVKVDRLEVLNRNLMTACAILVLALLCLALVMLIE